MKTRDEIRETTKGKIPRPTNYQYGVHLPEWELAETTLSRDEFVRQVEPMHDRIVVQLLDGDVKGTRAQDKIILTDAKPLIGGCRKARVLKTGPGRWIPGEWWKRSWEYYLAGNAGEYHLDRGCEYTGPWEWIRGHRRPVSVTPGQIVLIGNWVDLEQWDIALCAEGDVRSIWQN